MLTGLNYLVIFKLVSSVTTVFQVFTNQIFLSSRHYYKSHSNIIGIKNDTQTPYLVATFLKPTGMLPVSGKRQNIFS